MNSGEICLIRIFLKLHEEHMKKDQDISSFHSPVQFSVNTESSVNIESLVNIDSQFFAYRYSDQTCTDHHCSRILMVFHFAGRATCFFHGEYVLVSICSFISCDSIFSILIGLFPYVLTYKGLFHEPLFLAQEAVEKESTRDRTE